MLSILVIIVLSYLAGSIPTSIIISKFFFGFDIREKGSGNAGGTNAFRIMGWKTGLFVMLIDLSKGVLATYLISQIRIDGLNLPVVIVQIIAGISAVTGHIWTVFAGFKGGKGVGTAAGMLLVLYPVSFIICLSIFFLVLLITRYVSVSSMSATVSLPIVLLALHQFFGRPFSFPLFILALIMAVLIVFTHRSNIQRLMNGSENRIKKIL
ncbi:MAG TPA: glycerol-3-phosphate 1-O-acyltransferase [Bacteroidetes bacterium]|nr:glycerol-3-phosphate 1-O-acyltransferase [Bacteroidota bacterium]